MRNYHLQRFVGAGGVTDFLHTHPTIGDLPECDCTGIVATIARCMCLDDVPCPIKNETIRSVDKQWTPKSIRRLTTLRS